MLSHEYPRPDFVRDEYMSLNGNWQFAICQDKDYTIMDELPLEIVVPFCPESKLSGINHTNFMNKVLYRRHFNMTSDNLKKRALLNFGAVDYHAKVYVNKQVALEHKGGYTPFSGDITHLLVEGNNTIDVEVMDDTKDVSIPSGKQSPKKDSYFCFYTRTTGIWQTVWLEFVGDNYLYKPKITPSVQDKTITIAGKCQSSGRLRVEVSLADTVVVNSYDIDKDYNVSIQLDDVVVWDIDNPVLYDITLTLYSGDKVEDKAVTYCGFRTAELVGQHFYLNGKKVVLKQVLDQGFYPDGIYTAKSIQEIENDIKLAMQFGFNGARPHMKVFDPYYFYFADKLGFLTFGEFPNWCCDFRENKAGVDNLTREWIEVLERDYNHPSIIGWCPLNEVWRWTRQKCDAKSQIDLVNLTKQYDSTRMVIGASGGDIYAGDVWDYHTYSHNGKKLQSIIKDSRKNIMEVINYIHCYDRSKKLKYSQYKDMPQFLSEYGGLTFTNQGKSWGYSKAFTTEEEVVDKFIELTTIALQSDLMGICYTQLYDVEQERNGLLHYDRTHKLSQDNINKIRDCLTNN